MNNKELISELARNLNINQNDAQDLLNKCNTLLGGSFANMDTLSIQGFGAFEVKKKLERLTIHPVSGKKLLVPPKLVLNFVASKTFKDKIKDLQPDE